ncbi:VOC family protein [Halobacillus sp. Nhm2S1]|uniref:VOC family protein n=1 Tax=Halobacillus sp. Nhm2S1 TaxID=2866716 RepID=UPI001C738147|nr:VOC family protein [Halobacillus sp. Nhm2S1]MBX0356986.1 VOC family protein [Halobacillus sp. Nhm2S1]
MIEKIDTMCMGVKDVEKASSWYEEKLGFTVSFKGEGYCVLSIGNHPVPLTIEEKESVDTSNQNYPIFFTNHLDETYEQLKERKVNVDDKQRDQENDYFDFYDLDGNRLQVCCYR